MRTSVVILLTALLALAAPAAPAPPMMVVTIAVSGVERESVFAWRQTRSGRMLPLKEIERRVVPTMKGAQYIGVTLDAEAAVYTLKFLRDGAVIWVDVDARSGQVIGKTGR